MSDEAIEKMSNSMTKVWNNKTPEERERLSKEKSERMKKKFNPDSSTQLV